MQRASQKTIEWKRHKEVTVPWATYDAHRSNECKRIIDLRELLHVLDKPVHRREFKLSQLTILILLKLLFGISYRTLASATKDLELYHLLGDETSTLLQNHSEHHATSHTGCSDTYQSEVDTNCFTSWWS